MNEDIARGLREAADAHQPDRARILARVERGAAGPPVRHRTPSFARSWPRAALASLATAGILATGGLAVAGIVRMPAPSDTVAPTPATPTATPSPTVTPSPAVTPSLTPSTAPSTVAPAPVPTPASPRPTSSASSRPANGSLWSEGSVDSHSTVYWSQHNLVLKTTQPLTSLTVELRITQTGEVHDTGNWRTLPSEDFTVTVQESGGVLVYRWVLKPGHTVPVGQHEFAGQFNHATGVRSAANDSYRVDAQSAGGPASVWGGFGPAR
ncbi:hypothetical protein F7Q99_31260 [Streptomyces kaniharaensis]|uniref:Uncharacterized protein n=1 Tax=Streptomyces kaniharaensis TaxID=212423 RepID=A0A6N7KYD0_9ACTN|nr:hypothetical protein [Streptomyces kaniharaensis]MQS16550.1 hypothetical protein [Streptomyces kaniharaensis]